MSKIQISFVMTVYNKEKYLPSVLKALTGQTGLGEVEYIFCDDVSTDRSVEIIEEFMQDYPHVKIFRNTENKGPGVRINQGIEAAEGEYIRMLDSDDIFPLDSTEKMLKLAQKHNADMVYGKFTRTYKPAPEITAEYMKDDIKYVFHKNAMDSILWGKYTRMGQLIKADVLKKAGGAHPLVFIQDESIPLRCAPYAANGIIKMDANVVLVPLEDGNLSGSKIQLDHDRFLAYYYMIAENPGLAPRYLARLNQRAVSAFWKYRRKVAGHPYLSKDFVRYIASKIFASQPDMDYLNRAKAEFLACPKILRVK